MRYVPFLIAVLVGCSSSEFAVNEGAADTGTPGDDTAATDTGAPADDTAAPPLDTGVLDTAPPDAAVTCTTLPSNPAVVYVDKRSSKSKGTSECPFSSIKDALAFVNGLPSGSGKHQVRVAGGTVAAPLVYDEPMLVLKWQTTLTGDGMGRVIVTGGGACGDGTCMFVMEGGSTLEGVTVDAKGLPKVPLALGPGILTGVVVKSTEIVGTKDHNYPAIYVEGGGAVDLGPDMRIHDNGGHAILVKNIFSLKLTGAPGAANLLHRNLSGIVMIGGRLDLSGPTEVLKSKSHGIILGAPEKVAHTIDGLVSTENVGAGLYVDGGASLRMRRSKLLKNDIGLIFRHVGGSDLDLGTATDPGLNTIGLKLETNKRAGICLPSARLVASPAQGNFFNSCPPSWQTLVEGEKACDTIPGGMYKDLFYAVGATTGEPALPLDATNCTAK